jgi:serine/threonine protein kinase/tetratricopeptide (TPR) repeat protein
MRILDSLPSRYKVECLLGKGGFGEVYRVFDCHRQEEAALKILSNTRPRAKELLVREFRILSNLHHANLVRVYDFGVVQPHTPYFTMEFIDGRNLREFFTELHGMKHVSEILMQVLSALAYLHSNRILHGDLKPENILVVQDALKPPISKLLDFGLTSKWSSKQKCITGTPRFLAPEILSSRCYSPSSDLYALGASAIESVLGVEVPLATTSSSDFFRESYQRLVNRFRESGLKNPGSCASLILNLCNADPAERPSSAESALQSFQLSCSNREVGPETHIDKVFIGRKEEVGHVLRFIKMPNRKEKLLALIGPAGVGKKSIVARVVQRAQLQGQIAVDLGSASANYFSLNSLVESITSSLNFKQKKEFQETCSCPLTAQLQREKGRFSENPNAPTIIYDQIIRALHEVSQEQPLVLIVSDFDSYGRDFFQFLNQMIAQIDLLGSRIKILMTINSAYPSQVESLHLTQLVVPPGFKTSIWIEPFDDKLLALFLRKVFSADLFSASERRDILAITEGIPLNISTLVSWFVSSNTVQMENGKWLLDRKALKQVGMYLGNVDTFSIALNDLSPDEDSLLGLLAIYGDALTHDELKLLASRHVSNFDIVFAGLVNKFIIRHLDNGCVSFAHPLYSTSILNRMPAEMRKRLSLYIANVLMVREDRDSFKLAKYYIGAEIPSMALEYGIQAVDRMYSLYMIYDCLHLLQELEGLILRKGDRKQAAVLFSKLAPVEYQTGLPRKAIGDYEYLFKTASSDVEKAGYLKNMALIHRESFGNAERSKAILNRALHYAKRSGNNELIASIHYELGGFATRTSNRHYETAARLSKNDNVNLHTMAMSQLLYRYKLSGDVPRTLMLKRDILREISKTSLTARKEIYHHLYLFHFYNGEYEQAAHYVREKIRIERKQNDTVNMVYSLISLAGCHFVQGNYYEMISTLKEAYHYARKYGMSASSLTILANISLAYRSIAEYDQSLAALRQAEEIIRDEDIGQISSNYLLKPTLLYLVFGKATTQSFQRFLDMARRKARRISNNITLGHVNMALSLRGFNNMRYAEASKWASKALTSFSKAGDNDDMAQASIQLAIAKVLQADEREAAVSLLKAQAIYEKIHCEYLKPFLLFAKGMLARSTRSDDAKAVLTEALRTSRKIGTREITWQIQREFALHHRDLGEPHKALAYYRDAVETIKQITESIDEEELKASYLEVPFRKRVFEEIKELKKQTKKAG